MQKPLPMWNLAQKIIQSHLAEDNAGQRPPDAGQDIQLRIDQTLTQDATGTLVMLELLALELPRVKTEISAQYVDHNLLAEDFKNPDDHLFLKSACAKLGVWYSRPGNGVSHPIHMQRFGAPGKTLLGSDSHTCAAGALGTLAIGTGGFDVALAMAGQPLHLRMPKVFGVELRGQLPPWVSAKDVILEMLRRHGVRGGSGYILEYYGDGLEQLSVWDRHVIANMGAELGATTTLFPADDITRQFLESEGRGDDFSRLQPDADCSYDQQDTIELAELVPLIAKPSSPGNVVAVSEVEGEPIYQAYIGSSANPGFRDFAIAARMVDGQRVPDTVSFDINPSTNRVLRELSSSGDLTRLLESGARIHQPGCNGCIGMGQAPATGRNSLRTVPRNFPGRSGTREDSVWLCSPETAAASALEAAITDPRKHGRSTPDIAPPRSLALHDDGLTPPPDERRAGTVEVVMGPNIKPLPELESFASRGELVTPVLLKLGDDISTDEILPAGSRVLPFRSNIDKIAEFCFDGFDSYVQRAKETEHHAIVGGHNYGQGSSREHAALAPRYLGLALVVAKSFARIHLQNLINFGVLPATFASEQDYASIEQGDELTVDDPKAQLEQAEQLTVDTSNGPLKLDLPLSRFDRQVLLAGGRIAFERESS